MSSADAAHRSYLFAPGSDPAVMRKALATDADAVVLDLEDAVAPDRKDLARVEIAHLLDELQAAPASERSPTVHVRIDRTGDGYRADDVAVAVHPRVEAIRLPKTEDAAEVRDVSAAIARCETALGMPIGTVRLYPTIESARGVMSAESIAQSDPRVVRLVLGQADLVADIGGRGDDALTTLVPRALVVLASRAAGIGAPVDGATTDLMDGAALVAALERARALGFHGKSAIHPRQLAAINRAFTPDDDELAAAQRIVRAAEAAGGGATSVDGQLVDAAIVRRAHSLLALRRDR
jgi:citrate lyase subunit beta / citryl-CoA lyase